MRDQRRFVRRFELTIPLKKPLIVTYRHVLTGDEFVVMGLPAGVRQKVIYVRENPGKLVVVPISCILDIKPVWG